MFLFLSHFPAITCVVVSLSSQTSFTPAIKRRFFGCAAAFDLFFLFLPPYLYLQHLLLPTSSSTSYHLTPFVFSYGGMTYVWLVIIYLSLLWLQCVPDILGIGLSDWITKPQGILSLWTFLCGQGQSDCKIMAFVYFSLYLPYIFSICPSSPTRGWSFRTCAGWRTCWLSRLQTCCKSPSSLLRPCSEHTVRWHS